jgi:hypothetical protein
MQPETTAEVMLDGNDVTKLVECAVRHHVLTAIWNHPDSFRQIFQFGGPHRAELGAFLRAQTSLISAGLVAPRSRGPADMGVREKVELCTLPGAGWAGAVCAFS